MPGVLLYKAIFTHPEYAHSAVFSVVAYLVFWGLALRYRHHYQSRSNYDFGLYSMTLSYTKCIRYEREQQHFLLGCLLIPVNVGSRCFRKSLCRMIEKYELAFCLHIDQVSWLIKKGVTLSLGGHACAVEAR